MGDANSCCKVLTGLVVARMPLLLRILVRDSVTPLMYGKTAKRFWESGGSVHLKNREVQRSQFVNINASNSSVRELTVGIPQGSVMGPVLYLLYTTPLADVIRSHDLDYHMYADDNQLYLSFVTQEIDQAKSKIEECM